MMWSYRETWALALSDFHFFLCPVLNRKEIHLLLRHIKIKLEAFLLWPFLQVSVSTGTKKLLAATTFGAVSLLFLARHFQRRKGKKKPHLPQWDQAGLEFYSPVSAENGKPSWQWYFIQFNQQLIGLWSSFGMLAQFLVCDVMRPTCKAAAVLPWTLNSRSQINDLTRLISFGKICCWLESKREMNRLRD